MKPSLDKDGLDRNPHDIIPAKNGEVWYYEEPIGLEIYSREHGKIGTIRWASIRAALRRKDKNQ